MMTYEQIVKKMGKKKAVEFITENRSNENTAHEKTRGIRGRVRFRRCEHRVWVIDNYEAKPCLKCMGVGVNLKPKEFKPYFNVGLGAFVESRGEEKRLAKSMGLQEAG